MKTARRYHWTDTQKREMRRLYEQSEWSIEDTAGHFGTTRETIRYHLLRMGVTLRPRGMQTERARAKYSGERHHGWKGGRSIDSHGYVHLLARKHPDADKDGYVLEHRFVMERHVLKTNPKHPSVVDGRVDWKRWVAHHKNGNKSDNRLRNLELLPREAHHSWMHYQDEAKEMRNEIARLQRLLDENGIAY